jgi:glycosyltransferase involved in cell wall biosynthesis
MTEDQLDLSLIVPCFNEAPHLRQSVSELLLTLRQSKLKFEIIFVEDCSTDNTKSLLKDIVSSVGEARVIFHQINQGHGQSLMDGVREARGTVVGFIDIDLEVSCVYIPKLVGEILLNNYQVATGYRFYGVRFNVNAMIRLILSLGYRILYRWVLGIPLQDPETGYKFFRRSDLLLLLERVKNPGWFWDTEIMTQAWLKGFKILEFPCLFLRRSDKKTTIRVFAYTVRHFRELIAYRKIVKAK